MSQNASKALIGGRYQLLEVLGRGGMGEVHRGRDTRLSRDVAVKTLLPSDAIDVVARARMLREARAAAALEHPNIARVYDAGEGEDGSVWIVMELLRGRSVRDDVGRCTAARALDIVAALANALAFAHGKGVLHRDVTPENAMACDDGRIVLLDFGLAKGVAPIDRTEAAYRTEKSAVVGTFAYLAPEQARGRPEPASDQFALAIVAYELLTGTHPFAGETAPAILAAILSDEPAPPSRIAPRLPPAVDAVLLRGLSKDPGARFPHALELAQELSRALARAADGGVVASTGALTDGTIGRTELLQSIVKELRPGTITTLVGPGGQGKTRLAREASRARRRAGQGETVTCALSSAEDLPRALVRIATALDLRPEITDDLARTIERGLRNRPRVMLLLDGVDHLVRELRPIVPRWAAESTILVTSRERLGCAGERAVVVPPLEVPAAGASPERILDSPAVLLYLDRATRAGARSYDSPRDLADVAELVRALDGSPLAIEIAAARARVLGPAQVLARFRDGRDIGAAAGDPRHGSLRAMLEVSWSLLNEGERAALARASVFAGSFDLDGAATVLDLDDPLDVLESLVGKSLVTPVQGGREIRFALGPVVRADARRRLLELEDEDERLSLADRHAIHYARLGTDDVLDQLRGKSWEEHRDRFELEIEAVLAAEAHARGTTMGARAALAIVAWSVTSGGYRRAMDIATIALEAPLPDSLRARLLALRGLAEQLAGRARLAIASLGEAAEIASTLGDPVWESRALAFWGRAHAETGPKGSRDLLDRALAIAPPGEAIARYDALLELARLAAARGDDPSEPLLAALAIAERSSDPFVDRALVDLALHAFEQDRVAQARSYAERALAAARRRRDPVAIAFGELVLLRMDPGADGAVERCRRALEAFRAHASPRAEIRARHALVAALQAAGEHDEALALATGAAAEADEHGDLDGAARSWIAAATSTIALGRRAETRAALERAAAFAKRLDAPPGSFVARQLEAVRARA